MNNRRRSYCNNCNRYGHEYRECNDPITSYGIILIKMNNKHNINHEYNKENNIEIFKPNIKIRDMSDITIVGKYMNEIQFLMVQRKHSLGYIEFLRGRYKTDNYDGINFLFQQMVPEEIKKIGEKSFDELWYELWNNDKEKLQILKYEYETSKSKFDQLKNKIDIDLPLSFYVDNIIPSYKYHEWGFPKGRRQPNEKNKECAIREFYEETGIMSDKMKIIDELGEITENLTGTNGVKYRHIYYIAELTGDIEIDIRNNNEIGRIGFFTYNDAIEMIREYHVDKLELLKFIYMYYIQSLIIENKTEEKKIE